MEENTPVISIVIPVFNRPKLIAECLDSVLSQTYSNWECIVVDDGSSDGSFDVIKLIEQKDQRVRAIQRGAITPKGAPSCRQLGVEKSTGEFLIFLDSDDLLAPWALEERIKYFRNEPTLDVVLSNGLMFNSIKKEFIEYTSLFNENQVLDFFLQMHIVFQITSPTWKKSFITNNNIRWDPLLPCWQDVDYTIQAFSCNPLFNWASILPDYFIRKDEDPLALTSLSNISNKTLSNFHTYEKWLTNIKNPDLLKKHFPDYMLRKFEYLLPQKELAKMIKNHGSIIQNYLGNRAVKYLKIFNLTRGLPLVRGLVYRLRPMLTGIERQPPLPYNKLVFDKTIKKELTAKLTSYDYERFKDY
jgi:glycosyltransferase involved in cell wall biosynthesis